MTDVRHPAIPSAPRPRERRPLRGLLDRLIAGASLVPTGPVLDARGFGWTAELRAHWGAIRDEAVRVASPGAPVALSCRGVRTEAAARCPLTAALVERIPGLVSAAVATLAPGAHLPAGRGATKALITCHLGLVVPRDGDVRMRVADRVVRWSEGEALVFDDSYEHEVWNDSAGARIVLLLRVARPLAAPGRWLARVCLALEGLGTGAR